MLPVGGQGPARGRGGSWLWVGGVAVGVLVVWWLCVLRPATPGPPSFASGDLFGYFMPAYAYIGTRLRAGEIAWWNPWVGAGAPFVATLQPGALYPPRLLLLACDAATAMHASLVAHLLFAAVGTFALCRALGATSCAAAAAAAVFLFPGELPNVFCPPFLEAGAWLPIAALAVLRILEGRGSSWTIVLGTAAAMPVLAGGYQTSIYVGYGIVLVAFVLVVSGARRIAWGTLAFRAGGAVAIAAALVAPQVCVTLAWSASAARSAHGLTDSQIQPYWTPSLTTTLVYRVLHKTVLSDGTLGFLHLSIPAILLMAFGFATGGRRGALFGVVTLVFFGLALGPGTPWFGLYHVLPGLDWFRLPQRLSYLVAFFGAIGTASGVTVLGNLGARRHGLAWLAAATVVGALVVPARNTTSLPWKTPVAERVRGEAVFAAARAVVGTGRLSVPTDAPALGLGAFPRLGIERRVRVLQDYEPLASRRLATYLSAVADSPEISATTLPFLGGVTGAHLMRPTLLDYVAVTAIVLPASDPTPVRTPPLLEEAVGDFHVASNRHALPRAYLVPHARFAADEHDALATVVDVTFDGRREVVLVGAPDDDDARTIAAAAPAPLRAQRLIEDRPEQILIAVEPTEPSVLVLADSFAPGWSVMVDGVARRVWQANYLVRGVLVRHGDRVVEFSYHPPGLVSGLGVATGALASLALLVALHRRHERCERPQSA